MSEVSRPVARIVTPEPVVEGAGVHLRRSIGTRGLDHLDPFLLLDHFESVQPSDYEAGFPYHPHRGIETVTLVRTGEVRHRDSLGHQGAIGAGDIQWMTSGSGIMISCAQWLVHSVTGAGGSAHTTVPGLALTVSGRNAPSFFGVSGSMR